MSTNKPLDMPMMKPSFSMDEKTMPEIKNWQVGKEYKIEMDVQMTGLSKDQYIKGNPMMGRFEIKSAESMADKPVGKMSKSEYKKLYVKARSGNQG
jgi:hypothetical protein